MSRPPFVHIPSGVHLVGRPQAPLEGLLAAPEAPARGTIVLVPGFTGSKEDFIAILRPLADLGWRVLAVSLPGQGGAPGLGGRGTHTTSALANAVGQACDWLTTGPVHLVGHSMGGLVASRLVLAQPERFSSLTLMCSGPGALPQSRHAELAEFITALDAGVGLEQIWAHDLAADRAAGLADPPEAILGFLHDRFVSNEPAALADFAALLQSEPDRTRELIAVRQAHGGLPAVLVLTGAADDAWSVSDQQEMARRLGTEWILLPTGHSPAAEDPVNTAHILSDKLSRL